MTKKEVAYRVVLELIKKYLMQFGENRALELLGKDIQGFIKYEEAKDE